MLDATATLAGGVLSILGGPAGDRINVCLDPAGNRLVIKDAGREVAAFAANAVGHIHIDSGAGTDVVRIEANVLTPATVQGGAGDKVFYAGGGPTTLVAGTGTNKLVGGGGATILVGGPGVNRLIAGSGPTTFVGGSGSNLFYNVKDIDAGATGAGAQLVRNPGPATPTDPCDTTVLTADEVGQLLQRAAGASASEDAIIAIVDRGGNILGVRVEAGVAPEIQNTPSALVFAVDGAVAKARTGAFFGNNQAPLTSRTIQFISQSTITQREVESTPNIFDIHSTQRGPGFVAPVGIGGHFPPGVMFTPQVDLFAIEHTNRDGTLKPIYDPATGAVVGVQQLPGRFNVPGIPVQPPNSYGFVAFPDTDPVHLSQPRGIATLPGGLPIYKNGCVVGGIGVFFPGRTGYATEENSILSTTYIAGLPDRSLEAEYIAFVAVGGSSGAAASFGTVAGIPPLPGFDLPFGRIDLVGITLPLFGPGGTRGLGNLLPLGQSLGVGNPNSGRNLPVNLNGDTLLAGTVVPDGYLVNPRDGNPVDGVRLTAEDVNQIVVQGILQAEKTRAAIRLPLGSRTKMVFAISDLQGNILGLYRMPDATVFSLDVAVAKARNVAYYANPAELQNSDQVPGIPKGAAFENRTFRYLAEPRFPEGIDGAPPGPFSILNDGGTDPLTGLSIGPPLPASAFQSVMGHDAFNPGTNFHDPFDPLNQNGIVFFPGSIPLYKDDGRGNKILVGGLGVSGDGVDQDDVVTFAAAQGFLPPGPIQADQFFFNGIRLPFIKYNRNPEA